MQEDFERALNEVDDPEPGNQEVHMLSRRAFAGAILGTVVGAARVADAASYPSRPVR